MGLHRKEPRQRVTLTTRIADWHNCVSVINRLQLQFKYYLPMRPSGNCYEKFSLNNLYFWNPWIEYWLLGTGVNESTGNWVNRTVVLP